MKIEVNLMLGRGEDPVRRGWEILLHLTCGGNKQHHVGKGDVLRSGRAINRVYEGWSEVRSSRVAYVWQAGADAGWALIAL